MTMNVVRTRLSPPEIAKQLGVAPAKVREWIEAGELKAFNAATKADSEKPRWLVHVDDLRDFENRRSNSPLNPHRQSKQTDA